MDLQILPNKCLFKGNGFWAKKRDNHIELWSDDGESYLGKIPLDFTCEQIELTIRLHRLSEKHNDQQ